MAKNKQKIEYELDVKGLESIRAGMVKIQKAGGEVGDEAANIVAIIDKINKLVDKASDGKLPISDLKNISKYFKEIEAISNGLKSDDFLPKEAVQQFSKELQKVDNLMGSTKEKIKQLNKEQKSLKFDSDKFLNDEYIKRRGRAKNSENYKLDIPKQGAKDHLQDIVNKGTATKTVVNDKGESIEQVTRTREAVIANSLLKALAAEEEKRVKRNKDIEESLENQNKILTDAINKKKELEAQMKSPLPDNQKDLFDTASEFSKKNRNDTSDVIKRAQESGETSAPVSKTDLDKQKVSLGKVTKSLFTWAAAWNIGKRLFNEAVKTVSEMDKALTGMAVVTGQSRDEVNKLIPKMQELSDVTSTAMTDVANLTTEYVRQGRALSDAIILAEETAKAAKIAGISTTDSITYMTAAINGFNLSAKDATRVSDIFANLAAKSATDYEQLAVGLSKVSAQANLAGMSIEYTTALLAKGIETTQEAPESIGTALKTIIARMRELRDYGSVLEDGASVNKVENALAAAGIQLRDVNGEFRNLETIFGELGPKWDTLNTMQQQAIAQAVAGTRQQSRFVAIMQDWGRTQELATEAQDSAGASAAQYAQYAQGMEAAMTRMQTAWQGFVQSITSSKFIIGIVNSVTSVLSNVSKFLNNSPEVVKTIAIGLGGLALTFHTIHSVQKALGLDVNKQAMKEASDRAKKINDLQQEIQLVETLAKKEEKEKELKNAESELKASDNEKYHQEGYTPDENNQEEKDAYNKYLENLATVNQLKTEYNELETQASEKVGEYKEKEEEIQALLEESKNPVIQANEEYAKRLELKNEEIEKEKEKLEIAKKETKEDKEQEKIQKKIDKLNKIETRNANKILRLRKKSRKILEGSNSLISTLSGTVTSQLQNGVSAILSKLGPLGDGIANIVNNTIEWLGSTVLQAKLEEKISGEKEDQTSEENQQTVANATNTGLAGVEAGVQERIADAEEDQTDESNKQNRSGKKGLIQKIREYFQTKANNKAEQERSNTLLANAGISMADSAAKIPVAGWVIAAAILAAVGITAFAGIASARSKNGGADKKKNKKISDSQINIYQKKQQQKELQAQQEEFKTLLHTDNRTEEENERLEELTKSIQESDDRFSGKRGEELLTEINQTLTENNAFIQKEINSNYKLATSMNNLKDQTAAQQAIQQKMVADQEKLLKGSSDYSKLSDAGQQQAEIQAAKMAESFSKNIQDSGQVGETRDFAFVDYLKYAGIGLISPLGALTAAITADVQNSKKRKEEQENLQSYIDNFNMGASNIAIGMAAASEANIEAINSTGKHETLLTHQIKEYNRLVNENFKNDEYAQEQIAKQYGSIDFLANMATVNINGQDQLNNKFLDQVTKLTELGVITDEAISNIAETMHKVDQKQDDYNFAQRMIDEYSQGAHEDFQSLLKEFNLNENATVDELTAAMMAKVAVDDKGNFKKDKNNNYREGGRNGLNNAEFTKTINMLNGIKDMEFGSLSFATIKAMAGKDIGATGAELFQTFLDDVEKNTEAAKANGLTAEERVAAVMEAMNANSSGFSEYIEDQEKDIAKDRKRAEVLREQGNNASSTEERADYYKQAKALADKAAESEKNLSQFKNSLESNLKELTGNKTSDQLKDFMTRKESTLKNIKELNTAMAEGNVSSEQIQMLANKVVPSLQKLYRDKGKVFDPTEFFKGVKTNSVMAIQALEDYKQHMAEGGSEELKNNIASKHYELKKIQDEMKEASGEELVTLQAKYDIANQEYAEAVAQNDAYQELLKNSESLTATERKRLHIESQIASLEDDDSLVGLEKRLTLEKELAAIKQKEIDEKLGKIVEESGVFTLDTLQKNISFVNGAVVINQKWFNSLTKIEQKWLDSHQEAFKEMAESQKESVDAIKDINKELYDKQLELQNDMIEKYKAKLEDEKDALQKSLNKRKEIYEKYFDSLDREDSDEDFVAKQQRLRNTIASLSTASDSESLKRLKDAQKELSDLEKEQLDTERDRRKEATMESLDNQNEQLDQYYEERLKNEQKLWEEIGNLSKAEIDNLLFESDEKYKNSTDLNKDYLLRSYSEVVAGVMKMIHGEDSPEYQQAAERVNSLKAEYGFKHGGLVDYTGFAKVHGTPSAPEAFLNADQTALFSKLGSELQTYYAHTPNISKLGNNNNNTVTINGFNITVEGSVDQNNLQDTGTSLADAFFEGLRRTGLTVNIKN